MSGTGKYERLLERCKALTAVPTAVAHPCEESALAGAVEAAAAGLIDPIYVGPKAKIVEVLRQSFDHVRGTYGRMTEADFAKPAKLLRRDTEVREVFFYLITHEPEHMGQMIAYARMVNVTPPWTAERQAQQKKKK